MEMDAAAAAWAAVGVYKVTLAVTIIALLINALIAVVAVRGPERERQTRDLEDRKRRARLYMRAATAGLRAIAVALSLDRYIRKRPPPFAHKRADLENFKRRLIVRQKVIEHFLSLEIRDVTLVGRLLELKFFLRALSKGIDVEVEAVLPSPAERAAEILAHRQSRIKQLRKDLQQFRTGMEAKDASLQQDLDRVWKVGWFVRFWVKPATERD